MEEESSDSDWEIASELQKKEAVSDEEEEEGDSLSSDDDEVEEEIQEVNCFMHGNMISSIFSILSQQNAVVEEETDDEEALSSLSEDEDDDENDVVIKAIEEKPKQNGTPKPNKQKPKANNKLPEKIQQKEKPKKQPKKMVLKSGVIVSDLKEGTGPIVKGGKFVQVYYEGRLKDNNKMFDSTTKGPGFSFRVGKGEVIKGWDIGVVGMKAGGKRRIICPPGAAYGPKGSPPVIPPNATLVFDVELKKIS